MPEPIAKIVNLLKPKRGWFQFRLRTLFVLVAMAAIPCGCLKWKIVRKARERAAVVEIESLGGHVWRDWQARRRDEPPVPEWLRRLFGDAFFSNVNCVWLGEGT